GTLTATITITDPSLLNFDYPFESGEASSDFPWGDPTGNDNDWDDALNTQNVCFESSTPFYVVDPTTGLLSASPTTVGILPSCTQPPTGPPTNAPAFAVAPAGYPCHDRLHDTVTQDNGSYYSVALVAIIPPGWDPLMN
ncbi:MAG TPA: hypothetical protein VKT18_01425, partial [Acidimicrobiales bacterium]|nr:hypothetical protein [Acidimicrobiales bacterium]